MSYLYRLGVLFLTFFKISLFVIGGGLAMLPVVEQTFTRKHKWLTQEDILDMIILTQTVPGLVAVNAAIYVGTKIAGFIGAVFAVIGVMMPSLIIIMLIAAFFPDLSSDNPVIKSAFSAIRACITGILIATAIRLIRKMVQTKKEALLVAVCCILLVMKVNPIWVILGSMPLGCLFLYQKQQKIRQISKDASDD